MSDKMTLEDAARYLPDHARWVAMDRDGRWYWYSCRPEEAPATQSSWKLPDNGSVEHYGLLAITLDIDGDWHESRRELRPAKRWRAGQGGNYWSVRDDVHMFKAIEQCVLIDDARYSKGNYWKTRADAQRYADACKELAMKMHAENDS